MSDTQFHETRMGRTFYEHTMPKLVEQLERLNRNLELFAERLESVRDSSGQAPWPGVDSAHREQAESDSASDTGDRPGVNRPPVVLVGADGNALHVLGLCLRAAREVGWSAERIAAFRDEATSGDYDHLLAVVQKHFDVR